MTATYCENMSLSLGVNKSESLIVCNFPETCFYGLPDLTGAFSLKAHFRLNILLFFMKKQLVLEINDLNFHCLFFSRGPMLILKNYRSIDAHNLGFNFTETPNK